MPAMLRRLLPPALVALLALAPLLSPAAFAPALAPPGPGPAATGAWEAPFDGEVPAVNMVLLRTGEVLYWSGVDGHAGPGVPFLQDAPAPALARIWDPATGAVRTPSPEDGGRGDMFCSGQAVLPDGRVLVVGGTRYQTIPDGNGWHVFGLASARLLDPATRAFAKAPDMVHWRWYPTAIPLADGSALVASGISDLPDPLTHVTALERYDPQRDTWHTLPASASSLLPLYPRLHVVPSGPLKGDVFYSPVGCLWCPFGERTAVDELPWNVAQSLDLGTNAWTSQGPALLGVRQHGVAVMLTLRPPQYEATMLTFGGTLQRATVATSTAELAGLSVSPPARSLAPPMEHARWHLNGVLLPTGEVLAVGGGAVDSVMAYSAEDPGVLPAEVYDPQATDPATGLRGRWTTLASMSVPRMYHSTALLLPDGRVVAGGHVPLPNLQAVLPQVNERRLEVFQPPYLFRGPRPAIADAPATVAFGAAFGVASPDAADVARAVLMRPGAVTHSWDGEQRAVELAIEGRGAGHLTLRAPPDGDVAPPGHYMLFLVAERGDGLVPSVARFVRLG